ncbi:type II toxin-antitoxin system RnlB family antitoxin [Bacillus subtilis]|nr:type II toxin-antitoxin system RnlB family antitoxin [Bacillus subtilis]
MDYVKGLYEIVKAPDNTVFDSIIYLTSSCKPFESVSCIQSDLYQIYGNKPAVILFDLLLSNGNEPDRFYKATYDGEKLDLKTLESIQKDEEEESILALSSVFYRMNFHYLDASALTFKQRKMILKGIVFPFKHKRVSK